MPHQALEIMVFGSMALFSIACVYAGVRSLGGEMRLVRRIDDLGAPSPAGLLFDKLRTRLTGILIGSGKDRREIEENLHIAGYYSSSAPVIFVWARLGATLLVWGIASLVVAISAVKEGVIPYLPLALGAATYLLSKRVIGWSAARRRRKVEAELPFALDVFLMMLESGVSLDQTFRTFVRTEGNAAPIMKAALAALVDDIERGMTYETALERWSERLGVKGSKELGALFKRNLAHGSELSGALSAMAKDFTERRLSGAREAVGRKSVQMSVVMILFFMPAIFIILAGPAFVTLMNTLSGVGR